MKLIDADLLEKEIYKWMPKDQETWMSSNIPPIENLVVSIMMTIQEQPTVEAVPADYIRDKIRDLDNSIKKYGGRSDYSASVDSWIIRRGALEGLIAEWEETED